MKHLLLNLKNDEVAQHAHNAFAEDRVLGFCCVSLGFKGASELIADRDLRGWISVHDRRTFEAISVHTEHGLSAEYFLDCGWIHLYKVR